MPRVSTCTIAAAADAAGVSADTLRYYEKVGLVAPSGRTASGYRLYNSTVADRVRFVKGAQRMGLRLGEIKELLDIRDRGACPCGHTRALLEQRLRDVDDELVQLGALRRDLTGILDDLDNCPEAASGPWRCETEFTRKGGEPR